MDLTQTEKNYLKAIFKAVEKGHNPVSTNTLDGKQEHTVFPPR